MCTSPQENLLQPLCSSHNLSDGFGFVLLDSMPVIPQIITGTLEEATQTRREVVTNRTHQYRQQQSQGQTRKGNTTFATPTATFGESLADIYRRGDAISDLLHDQLNILALDDNLVQAGARVPKLRKRRLKQTKPTKKEQKKNKKKKTPKCPTKTEQQSKECNIKTEQTLRIGQ
jgi:hypothetical protein